MKINKYKYKYIKSLIKQFRKKLSTSNFKKQGGYFKYLAFIKNGNQKQKSV